tara:strand:- start:201 stop:455 length:255 start_codon:yes stop_codon:yes gene_type:complete
MAQVVQEAVELITKVEVQVILLPLVLHKVTTVKVVHLVDNILEALEAVQANLEVLTEIPMEVMVLQQIYLQAQLLLLAEAEEVN